jgi:RecA-family ATPase
MLNQFEEQVKEADRQLIGITAAQQAVVGITAADLMQKTFPEPRWAIPGILPEGCNLLAGKPKKGKSIFALNIGLSIAQGGLALGKIPVEQGAVIYLALEDTERRLQGRLKQMMSYDNQAPAGLHLFTKWPRMDAGGLELLEAKITEIPNLRLVIIDTLQKFRKPAKGNANLYAEDYETVTKIKDVADRLGVCILLIHHLRKAESDDIFDTLSGSLGLTGGADGNLVMENAKGQTTLHITGRDVEGIELAIELDNRILTWQLLGERAEVKKTNEQQRLYNALKESTEPLSPKKLADITGLKVGSVKSILAKFLEEGSVRRSGYGAYQYNKDN